MSHQRFWMRSIPLMLFAPLAAFAQSNQTWPGWNGPGPWHMMWGGGGWGFWWIFPLMMFILMILLCGFVMMRGPWSHRDHHADTTTSAMRLLNERFAQGEISKDEFEEKKAILARRA